MKSVAGTKCLCMPQKNSSTETQAELTVFKFLGSAVGIIFIIGLLVVIGLLALIF